MRTHLIAFDTAVVDLTADVDDPVELLMKVQLGGGTDIAKAVDFAAGLVDNPRRTIVVLITDFYEGGDAFRLVRTVRSLVEQGTHVVGLAALDEEANPDYNAEVAQQLANAHQEAGVVLALRRRAEVEEGDEPPSAEALGRRKAGGTRLSALAAGNVVTESALRAANRMVRITESRVARTTVVPSSGTWQRLPPGVLVEDLDAEAARLAGLPPAVVRPRVVAEEVRAVMVEEVEDVHYLPGQQRLVVAVRAPLGRATVSLAHTTATDGAVDALAEALAGTHHGPDQLRRVGLAGAAAALTDLCTATGASFGDDALDRWADTHLRLLVTAEQL